MSKTYTFKAKSIWTTIDLTKPPPRHLRLTSFESRVMVHTERRKKRAKRRVG